MEMPEAPPSRLSFNQFKDWAFLAIVTGLVSVLIGAIVDLNHSVKELSVNLGEKSGEITMILESLRGLDRRVEHLEHKR